MIKNKYDLKYYLRHDAIALGRNPGKHPSMFPYSDIIWKYQRLYRKYEYMRNTMHGRPFRIAFAAILKIRFDCMSQRLGFSLPINVFGPGLSIAHYGSLVVNSNTQVGSNCRIQENVTIGATNGGSEAPHIGNNVFIGSSAVLLGGIVIADDIAIGAGAVVTH